VVAFIVGFSRVFYADEGKNLTTDEHGSEEIAKIAMIAKIAEIEKQNPAMMNIDDTDRDR
jgi:capsid portal protein